MKQYMANRIWSPDDWSTSFPNLT